MDDLLLQTLYGLLLFETPKSNKQKQRLENVPESTRNILKTLDINQNVAKCFLYTHATGLLNFNAF